MASSKKRIGKRGPGRPPKSRPEIGKEVLLNAAKAILAERGSSQNLTITEVAKRAGVTTVMINYRFGSKAKLIATLVEDAMSEAREKMSKIAPSSDVPVVKLQERVKSIVEFYSEHPYISRLLKEQVFYSDGSARKKYMCDFLPSAIKSIEDILAEGLKRGDFRKVDPILFWVTLVGMCEFFFLLRPVIGPQLQKKGNADDDLDFFSDYAADILLRGIASVRQV